MLKIAYASTYSHPLPKGHRFPMEKYELLPEQLMYEGLIAKENFFVPEVITEDWILSTHTLEYWQKLKYQTLSKSEIRATGFPLSKELIHREIQIAGGSVQAALYAIEFGIAMNIAGGTHHAFADRGEGFCLLNDIGITANYLLKKNHVENVLVIDLDVHQGNGTASLFGVNDQVFTFSMHGKKNYPHRKEVSDLDIALEDGVDDEIYLSLLAKNLELIETLFKPDFIIYQCGVDVLATDKLGRLGMTIPGIKIRDKMVLEFGKKLNAPIMCCMGGGYSPQISKIVDAHTQVYRIALELFF